MMTIQAKPNEHLVLVKNGRFTSRGIAGRAVLWPGTSYALVPSTNQEAAFAMTQETKDGIPLRFKGIIVYQVTRPELAAEKFDFAGGRGHEEIKELMTHVALGRLRALVSHLTMVECIEQRETVLTETVAAALHEVAATQGSGEERTGWGIEIGVVQVAQVFIIDEALRAQLEAELRNTIRSRSELSAMRTKEELRRAQLESDRALEREALENERQKHAAAVEKLELAAALERKRIEAEAETRALEHERRVQVLPREREAQKLANELERLRVESAMLGKRAEHELKKDLIETEQVTAIAEALGTVLEGASLTVYGENMAPLSGLMPVFDALSDRLRQALAAGAKEKK